MVILFLQNVPRSQPQNYGLLYGPRSGQATQIHDMAASETSDTDFYAFHRGLDANLQLHYVQNDADLANEAALEAARTEDALNQQQMMLQSIDQRQPVYSLMQSPPLPRPLSRATPPPHQLLNTLNQQLDMLVDVRRTSLPSSSSRSTASLQRGLLAALQLPQRGDELEIIHNTPPSKTLPIMQQQEINGDA